MADIEIIGSIIRDGRRKKNLTQENLAELLSVTKQAVSNWENGKNRVDEDSREKLSEIIGYKIDYNDHKGDQRMKIKQIEDIDSLEEIEEAINEIIEDTVLDNEHETTIKTLLRMTIWCVIGFERYKYHYTKGKDMEYDWESVGWVMRALVDDKESYPFEDFKKLESYSFRSENLLKDKISYMGYASGAELFEDFDDDGYIQGFPQLIGRITELYSHRLGSLLPNTENDIITIYKIAVYNASRVMDSLYEYKEEKMD